jgi:hypothetical protein
MPARFPTTSRLAPAFFLTSALVACGGGGGADDTWRVVHEHLPGALISVWGANAQDVWTVGGDPGDGGGGLVLHFDGTSWRRLRTGVAADFWWVHGIGGGGPVWLAGSGGTILRYAGGAFAPMPTPHDGIVFGVWAAAPDDLWAVGETALVGGHAFVWRSDGTSWRAVGPLPTLPAGDTSAFFKVWGRAANDVVIVGMDGAALRWDGATLSPLDVATTRRLLTVHAAPGPIARYAAVGGFANAVIVESEAGGPWRDVTPDATTPQLFGVWLTEGGGGQAVGVDGAVLERTGGRWRRVETGLPFVESLHSVWVDPDGGVWAVGGDLIAPPLVDGALFHRGRRVPGGRYAD